MMASTLPVFLHIPRSAGTSIRQVFEARFDKWERLEHDDVTDVEGFDQKIEDLMANEKAKAALRVVMGHFQPRALWKMYNRWHVEIFTVLRDPVQRVISEYYWARKEPLHIFHKLCNAMSLEEVIESRSYVGMENLQTRMLASALDANFIGPGEFTAAMEQLDVMSIVGLQSEYEETCRRITTRYQWDPFPVLHVNEVKRPTDVGKELTRLIENHNFWDIALWDEAKRRFYK